MRIPLRSRRRKPPEKLTPEDVIRGQLQTAHAIHPGHLMPGAVVSALTDAGFTIISEDDLDSEIALAHQAGVDEGQGW
jgi:hypothetical protein